MTQEPADIVNPISGATYSNVDPADGRKHTRFHAVRDMVVKWNATFMAVQQGELEGIPREMDLISVGLLGIHIPDMLERLAAANAVIREAEMLHNWTHGVNCADSTQCGFVDSLAKYRAAGGRHIKSAKEMTERVEREVLQNNFDWKPEGIQE